MILLTRRYVWKSNAMQCWLLTGRSPVGLSWLDLQRSRLCLLDKCESDLQWDSESADDSCDLTNICCVEELFSTFLWRRWQRRERVCTLSDESQIYSSAHCLKNRELRAETVRVGSDTDFNMACFGARSRMTVFNCSSFLEEPVLQPKLRQCCFGWTQQLVA